MLNQNSIMELATKREKTIEKTNLWEYISLANALDLCMTKEHSEFILLNQPSSRYIYEIRDADTFAKRCLYHFIRSRIAFFQLNFVWFQQETIALINLWNEQWEETNSYFGDCPASFFHSILVFGYADEPVGFSRFFSNDMPRPKRRISIEVKAVIAQLKRDAEMYFSLIG